MTKTIDFNNLSSGTVVGSEYSSLGVTISGITAQGAAGRAMIFDTARPTGGDTDLATENLGKVLIISEDGDQSDPDDNAKGGTLRFTFETPAIVNALTFLDVEAGAYVHFYDHDDILIDSWFIDSEDNGQSIAHFDVFGVAYFDVDLQGSGAVDTLIFEDLLDLDGTVQGTHGDDIISAVVGYTDADGDSVDSADAILPGVEGTDSDLIEGFAGNDVVHAGADNDTVYAGEGDDSVDGGAGDDLLFGGGGDDTLSGGQGADWIDGDEDADLIAGGAGDTAIGGAGGNDSDTLDLRGMGDFVLTGPDGSGQPVGDSNGNGVDGRVVFVDANGNPDGRTIDFREIEIFLSDETEAVAARDDRFTTDEDTASVLGNVLANDAPEGAVSVVAVGKKADAVDAPVKGHLGGLITISADGTIRFDPTDAFDGLSDGAVAMTCINYTIADAHGRTADAVIAISVEGRNDGPVAAPNTYEVTMLEAFGDSDGNVITDNTGDGVDTDIDGDAFAIVAVNGSADFVGQPVTGSAGGVFVIHADGDVDFDSHDAFDHLSGDQSATTSATYTIADAHGAEDTAVVTFRVYAGGEAIVVGTDDDDVLITEGPGAPDVGYPYQEPADGYGNNTPFPGYAADSDPYDQRDTIEAGNGDDIVRTGDDNDVIFAGAGNDRVSAGYDDDIVFGGAGDDMLEGSEGNDSIDGGDGDDTIYGGLENELADRVSFPDDAPDANGFQDLVPENNGDRLDGGEGNDRLFGQDDDDVLLGGAGNDLLDGGVDDDLLAGGAGQDTLIGGAGRDAMFGGAGSDLFKGGNGGDVAIGGEDADGQDVDVLDLSATGVQRIEYTSTDRESGRVIFNDGSAMTFAEIEEVVPCFTPGTLIATPRGERLIEDLRVGDRIITRDNGIQKIAWIGRKQISGRQLVQNPHLRPVLIKRGSLGQGLPERDMMVSPNHRMLVSSEKTQLYFEENEVLAAAKHMAGADGIHVVDALQTTYIHFMFERHEVVLANGAWSESFQPGDYTLKGLGGGQRKEIFEIFPELATVTGLKDYQAARKSLKKHEAQLLLD